MKYPKRSQYKHAKSQYRVRNWREYEVGLRRRGDPTVWLSHHALGVSERKVKDHAELNRGSRSMTTRSLSSIFG